MESSMPQMQDRARNLQENLAPQIEEARRNLTELNTRVVGFIRQNPGTCLLGAIAVGFVIGRIASRR